MKKKIIVALLLLTGLAQSQTITNKFSNSSHANNYTTFTNSLTYVVYRTTLTTNYTLHSVTYLVYGMREERDHPINNYKGTICSNIVAIVWYDGNKQEVIMKSTIIGTHEFSR